MRRFSLLPQGRLRISHGTLRFPQRLICGVEPAWTIRWGPWRRTRGGATARGRGGALLTVAQCEWRDDRVDLAFQVINPGAAPLELREIAWGLEMDQPDRIELLPGSGIAVRNPWELNLPHELLCPEGRKARHLRLKYGRSQCHIASTDPSTFGTGLVRCEPKPPDGRMLTIAWHRIEPHWEYNGLLAQHPLSGLWIYEGQTRSASLVFALTSPAMQANLRRPAVIRARLPLCSGASLRPSWRKRVLEKLQLLRIEHGEYAGLFAGGYCHRAERQLEPHVNRAEYGEFLLHDYLRSRDPRVWRWCLEFAGRFQEVAVNRSRHPVRGGAVRGRYGDHVTAHPIRSMRGAAFFWDLGRLTGRDDFRQTARGIAQYLRRTFPWNNARQGAAVRDLVYLHRVTGEAAFLETARDIIATLARRQRADGSWFEYWDEQGEACRYDPSGHHGGEWISRACLKPEMASYNINGIIDALAICRPGELPGARAVLERAVEWMASVQSEEGPWRFPNYNSAGLYGYGLFQDAAAMLKAGRHFNSERYERAGRRALEYGLTRLKRERTIPAVIGLGDFAGIESSFTYFYALEALAIQ